MTAQQKLDMQEKIISRNEIKALNRKTDMIEVLDLFANSYSLYMDACQIIREGCTPKQNEQVFLMECKVDTLRDIIMSHLDVNR